MITAKIEFTNRKTGATHIVEIDWDTLLAARSASAEAWNASCRLCEPDAFADWCRVRKAVQSLREYRDHHEALRKVLGLSDEDWQRIMSGPSPAAPGKESETP